MALHGHGRGIASQLKITKKKTKASNVTMSNIEKPFPKANKQGGAFFDATLDEGIDKSAIRRSQKSRRGISGK